MDGLLKNASNGMSAPVVRQFAPSRIERQLLAQVFELVSGQRKEADAPRWTGQGPTGAHRVEVLEARIARRDVA